ncbi:LapA family protein [Microaceticoccus formicicus]|uniref:LapA family protein n=1 Tax=Microaceticoccus formicicus TaxID=3118105 RepID=UPI003CD02330|nr:LapA family protein [Peptoniphilaceae bacterium AMB_02]
MVLLVIILLMLLLVAVFALKNSQVIIVDLFFNKIEMSQAILILSCVALGIFIMLVFYFIQRFKASRRIKSLEKELLQTKNDLEKARAQIAVAESELRSGTSKTLEESILDQRVTGFDAKDVVVEENPENSRFEDDKNLANEKVNEDENNFETKKFHI